jgi:hypothetical protein
MFGPVNRSLAMESYIYRDYTIDLYPSAGGFKAFIYRPGEDTGLDDAPSLAGPDGGEDSTREKLLWQCRAFVDSDITGTFSYAGSDERWHRGQTEGRISYESKRR